MENGPMSMVYVDIKIWDPSSASSEPVKVLKKFVIWNGKIEEEKAKELLDYLNKDLNLSIKATLKDKRAWYGWYVRFSDRIDDLVAFSTEQQEKFNYVKGTYDVHGTHEKMRESLSWWSKDYTEEEKEKYRQESCRKYFERKKLEKMKRKMKNKVSLKMAEKEVKRIKSQERKNWKTQS